MNDLASIFVKIFIILNPIATIPLFIKASQTEKPIKLALETTGLAYLLALIFLILGDSIFYFLGISIDAFKIAGGAVLFLLGLQNVLDFSLSKEKNLKLSILIATPMLTGPGMISLLINLKTLYPVEIVFIALTMAMAITFLILLLSSNIYNIIGPDGFLIINKVFGLLIMSIATSMILTGMKAIY